MEEEKRNATEGQENNNGGGNPGGNAAEGAEKSATESKPMSFDEFLKQPGMQAEFDKRVGKGIDTAVSKESARLKTVFNEQLDEQARLAKMTDAERTEYLDNKRQSELSKREADIVRRELTAGAKDKLAEKGLPIGLADILVYTDEEACNKSLEAVEAVFTAAVEAKVNAKLKGDTPPKDAKTEGAESKTDTEKEIEKAAKIAGIKL